MIIIDSGKNESKKGLELCKNIREISNQNIKIIFTDTAHEKEEILKLKTEIVKDTIRNICGEDIKINETGL